jgi:hypothetical protein
MTKRAVDPRALKTMVGRTLKSQGFRKSEYHASGMVRGYGTFNSGYKFHGDGGTDGSTVWVTLCHEFGNGKHYTDRERVADDTATALDKYARVLRDAGFTVERRSVKASDYTSYDTVRVTVEAK